MDKKQTAVEWIIEQVFNSDWKNMIGEDKLKLFEQAKEMEKQQQKIFFDCGRQFQLTGEGTFSQVHNEIFNKKQ